MTEKKSHGGKIAALVIVLLIAGVAGFGYFNQSSTLKDEAVAAEKPIDTSLLAPKPSDMILGDMNAMVTIVEYSSLSCPHCAHFHKEVLPALTKEFITTGKAKLVVRHFPLNEPALKAAEVVECSGNNGGQRSNFMKVLFDMQEKWAFGEDFLKNLKQIALVGGIDSASFDSCTNDKDMETKILSSRQEATDKLDVNSTPTFFINNKKLVGDITIEAFRAAIAEATAPAK